MKKDDFKILDNALALLHDFISNHGAKENDYIVLNNAENVLKNYLQEEIK